MLTVLKNFLDNKVVRFVIAVVAAITMYYTDDHVDQIILGILSFLGITPLVLNTLTDDNK